MSLVFNVMETTIHISMSEQKANSITKTIKQFGNNLFGFVRGRVKSTEDDEDVLQDVWYQLSKLNNIAELENVSAWLYEVARNKITDKGCKKTNLALEDYSYENDDGEFNILLPLSVKKMKKTILLHKDRKINEENQPTFRHIWFFPTQKLTLRKTKRAFNFPRTHAHAPPFRCWVTTL